MLRKCIGAMTSPSTAAMPLLQVQLADLYICQSNYKILRKPIAVAADLLIKPLGAYPIDPCQIAVQHHTDTANGADPKVRLYGQRWHIHEVMYG